MITKASEYSQKIQQNNKAAIEKMIAKIEEKIAGSSAKQLQIEIPKDIFRNTIDHVIRLYREAGWGAEYESNQKEGDWITLTSP